MKDTEAEVMNTVPEPPTGAPHSEEAGGKRPSTEYYEECRLALTDPASPGRAFLVSIGLNPETALHAGIGFDPAWSSCGAAEPGPHLIIPVRPDRYQTYGLEKEKKQWQGWGQQRPWNMGIMFRPGVHFITSGVFDALAVMEEGFSAAALLGGYNDQLFLDELEERDWQPDPEAVYVIALGASKGETAVAEWLAAKLAEKGAAVCTADLCSGSARVYEAHKENPEQFGRQVASAVETAAGLLQERGADLPAAFLTPGEKLPEVSAELPPKVRQVTDPARIGRPSPRFGVPVSKRERLLQAQKQLREADDVLRSRIENNGISLKTLVRHGFGYAPELAAADQPEVLPVVMPVPNHRMVQLDWSEDGIGMHEMPDNLDGWNLQAMKEKGITFITRDIGDALVAMDSGQKTVMLPDDAGRFLQWIERNAKFISRGTVFVIALGSSEQDTKNADDILRLLKEKRRTATRAAIRGESATLFEEYQRDPALVRRRFAVAVKKCQNALEARAQQEAAQKAKRSRGSGGRCPAGRPQHGHAPGSRVQQGGHGSRRGL